MIVPGSANPLLLASAAVAGGYQIERSLRFNSADSAYLNRTPASASNRKTWTFSFWYKRVSGDEDRIFLARQTSATVLTYLQFNDNIADAFTFAHFNGASHDFRLTTSRLFRDFSAWYHIVVALDTTQSTASDRIKIYVNGLQETAFATAVYPSQNTDWLVNDVVTHEISSPIGANKLDGYLADIHFIDGQALDPTSFAETNITTGQWVPKEYTGTYGTNGFRLAFADNSNNTATTLGKDSSPNGNNWTPNNLSVTAGAGNDSLVDTPTSYGTDTGAGGQVRGNYATLNPLVNPGGSTLSNGNLDCTAATGAPNAGRVVGTIAVSSGKWYWECVRTGGAGSGLLGIALSSEFTSIEPGRNSTSYGYYGATGQKYNSASLSSYGATWTTNDVVGVALDLDAGTLVFYKNGASQGTAFSSLSGSFVPAFSSDSASSTSFTCNFGQRPFAYTAPSGFKALCDTNLPAPVVAKPNTVFDAVLYTANVSGGKTIPMPGGFSPDLVWIKNRDNVEQHYLADTVRGDGSNKYLRSNSTNAEGGVIAGDCSITFGSSGFTLTDPDFTVGELYFQNRTYVSWNWDAGSSTVTNTEGSITSQVRANASAGFSIVTYTGTGANATVGHGLGVAPGMVIVKRRNTTSNWQVRHTSIAAADSIQLNLTNAAASATTVWNSTAPNSTVFSIGTDASVNASGGTYVAYCFAPVAGYSSFGSYTGNGSADGPFVYTGFRPRWILFKASSYALAQTNWTIWDTARDSYNVIAKFLRADLANAEGSVSYGDILSNGFKFRYTDVNNNASGQTYIYAAFAENPFQFSRAR